MLAPAFFCSVNPVVRQLRQEEGHHQLLAIDTRCFCDGRPAMVELGKEQALHRERDPSGRPTRIRRSTPSKPTVRGCIPSPTGVSTSARVGTLPPSAISNSQECLPSQAGLSTGVGEAQPKPRVKIAGQSRILALEKTMEKSGHGGLISLTNWRPMPLAWLAIVMASPRPRSAGVPCVPEEQLQR